MRERLRDDAELFRSMLKRLFGEFTGAGLPAAPKDAEELQAHAKADAQAQGQCRDARRQRHPGLARDVEVACAAGDVELASRIDIAVAEGLTELQANAASATAAAALPANRMPK